MKLKDFTLVLERRRFIESKLNLSLSSIGHFSLDEKNASSKNCENMIGVAQIPLGVAGPLEVKGRFASGNFYIPLATTEGALIASVNRGCKAITLSKGAIAAVENVGATRGPVFKTKNITESLMFKKWLDENLDLLQKKAAQTSFHLKLLKIGTRVAGKYVYVRFYFDTKEAMGMNMVTIATQTISDLIENKLHIKCLSIAGNFDIDKKPGWLNFISGRGKRIWAEVEVSSEVLSEVLKTSAENIYNVWLSKCMLGSIMSGSLSFNSHYANIIASIFAATGQDLAHVVEGSLGLTTTEVIDRSLYISIYLPSLMVGTIGGGTALSTQKEALSILGINHQKGSSLKLAEIIAGAVLAGELSLLASLAEGSLTVAHQRLARGIK